MSSENTGKENIKSRIENVDKSGASISPFFVFSIIATFVGVAIIAVLIFLIPNYPEHSTGVDPSTIYDTFFYNIKYSWYNSYDNSYRYLYATPSIGYFILMPIAMIGAAIGGTGFLIRNKREAKQLIFINWGLYFIPIIMIIVKSILNDYNYWDSLLHPLGFYPIYMYIFIQFALLLDGSTFLDWAGFSEKSKVENEKSALNYRKTIAIIFLIIFTLSIGIPLFGPLVKYFWNTFAYAWLSIGLSVCWLLFGEVIRITVHRSWQRRKIMEYIINNYVGKNELSITDMSNVTNLNINLARKVIQTEIINGRIFGEISEDGTLLYLLSPETYFKKEEKELDVVEPRVAKEFETQPLFFWISIVLSIIAVGSLTVAIAFIPKLEYHVLADVGGYYTNFFYRWYYYNYSSSTESYLRWIRPHIGATILLSISAVAFLISGLGFLVRNKEESKKLIYANWLLYLIPIGTGAVKSAIALFTLQYTYRGLGDVAGMPVYLSFFYLTPIIFVQGSQFIMDNTFSEWSSFKGEKAQMIRPIKAGRMASAIIFFLIFAWMLAYPLSLLMTGYDNDPLHITHISLYFVVLAWWFFLDLVLIVLMKGNWKRIIERTIGMGIYNLDAISQRFDIPLVYALESASILIRKGAIIGELDVENKQIIPITKTGEYVCSSCGKVNEKDAKFCSHCGSKVDFSKIIPEAKPRTITEQQSDQELLLITKTRLMGFFSNGIFAFSTIGYIILVYFGSDYYFASIPLALFLIAGTILGVKASYYPAGKVGYALNIVSLLIVVIFIVTILGELM